jgi:uncharacterized protein YllA (UPF0747 family)
VLNGRRFTARELAERAESLSPNAILRPVAQDSMLPTVAYIGGPAEVAYLAQSAAIYDRLLGRMPVAMPRAGFTLLDARTEKRMERYGVGLRDLFEGPEAFRERLAGKLVPPSARDAAEAARQTVEGSLERLRSELAKVDPTLTGAADRSLRKIRYQLEKLERKTRRETLRRDGQAARDAESIYGLLYPEKHLQERLYSFLPFLAKHGTGLIEQVFGEIQLDCADHRAMVV